MLTNSTCRGSSVVAKSKRMKIFYFKRFVFVDKGNFDIKKVLKWYIEVNVFVAIARISEK